MEARNRGPVPIHTNLQHHHPLIIFKFTKVLTSKDRSTLVFSLIKLSKQVQIFDGQYQMRYLSQPPSL
jgi:hypothetical protein